MHIEHFDGPAVIDAYQRLQGTLTAAQAHVDQREAEARRLHAGGDNEGAADILFQEIPALQKHLKGVRRKIHELREAVALRSIMIDRECWSRFGAGEVGIAVSLRLLDLPAVRQAVDALEIPGTTLGAARRTYDALAAARTAPQPMASLLAAINARAPLGRRALPLQVRGHADREVAL